MTFVKNDNKPLQDYAEAADLYCVAIGSSAGGFEALKELLVNLPPGSGNFSIVLSYPLEDGQFNTLVLLLSPNLQFNMCRPAQGEKLKCGLVYASIPGETIRLINTAISLQNAIHTAESFAADALFQSVALYASDKSVAVVLSGTGNDGSAGIKSVKAAGGKVLVQIPQTAKYDGMPKAAICTCSIDEILNPADIGKTIGYITAKHYLPVKEKNEGKIKTLAQQGKVVIMSAQLVSIETMVKETLYASYQHAYILIDKTAVIREMNGDTALYLHMGGKPLPCNLYNVLREELLAEVKYAVEAALRNGTGHKSNIEIIELSNKIVFIRIIVKPVETIAGSEDLFVVILENLEPHKFTAKGINITDKVMVGTAMQQLASRLQVKQ